MNTPPDDPLREAVRAAVTASSAQAFALRAGVSDETVYALLRGARIGKGSRRLIEDAVKNSDSTAAPSGAGTRGDFTDGVLHAARAMSVTVTALIEEAIAARQPTARPATTATSGPSPTAERVYGTGTPEAGLAMLEELRRAGAAERERTTGGRKTPRRKRSVG